MPVILMQSDTQSGGRCPAPQWRLLSCPAPFKLAPLLCVCRMASFSPCTKGLPGPSGCSLLWLHCAKRFSHRPHPVNPANDSWWHHSTAAVQHTLPSPAAVSRAHHMTCIHCLSDSVACTLWACTPRCRLHWWPCKETSLCFPWERTQCAPALSLVLLTATACAQFPGCCGLPILHCLPLICTDMAPPVLDCC